MTTFVQNLNNVLALGVIVLQLASVALLVLFFTSIGNTIKLFVGKHGIRIAFILVLAATSLSLFYSDILGFIPCGLCWFQRIFLYSQVVILGIASFKKDLSVTKYSIGLSSIGGLISLYQHYIQMGGSALVKCPAAGEGVDCARRILFEFGYITFPLMSFSIFLFLIITMVYVRRYSDTRAI